MNVELTDRQKVKALHRLLVAEADDWEVLGSNQAKLIEAVRRADEDFEKAGGATRHWVRECFWPCLRDQGLITVPGDYLASMLGLLEAQQKEEPIDPLPLLMHIGGDDSPK